MKRLNKSLGNIALTVGSCVGVGFVSGKEPQFFVGSNGLIFAAVFLFCVLVTRKFCKLSGAHTLAELCDKAFGKVGAAANYILTACNFVCLSALAIGAEKCLSLLLHLSDLPLYAVILCFFAAILLKSKMNTLKIFNGIGIAFAIVWLIVAATQNTRNTATTEAVTPVKTILYAVFCVTTSLSVNVRLSAEPPLKTTAISSAVLSAMLVVAANSATQNNAFPLLPSEGHTATKILAAITVAICSATGLACNAMPIDDFLHSALPDDCLRLFVIFALTMALSLVGVDSLMRYGYVFVALLGTLLTATLFAALLAHKFGKIPNRSKSESRIRQTNSNRNKSKTQSQIIRENP